MMALVLRTLIERCKCWQTGVIEGTKGIWKECGHLTNFQISPWLMWLTIKYYRSILSKQHAKTYTLYPQRSINAFSISASKVCEFAEPFKCYCGILYQANNRILFFQIYKWLPWYCVPQYHWHPIFYMRPFFLNFQWQTMVQGYI